MKLITGLILMMVMAGCMSERGYMLRKKNAENQAAHPPVYEVGELRGPITLGEGSKVVLRSPTQPFQALPVPDEVEAQRGVVRDVLTGAVIGCGLHQAGSSSTVKGSHNTTTTGGEQ